MKMTNVTNNDVMTDLLEQIEPPMDKLKLIFKFNNALVLEKKLKEVTGDNSYSLISEELMGNIVFHNEGNCKIELDVEGNIIQSPEELPKEFISLAKKRLSRTSQMVEEFRNNIIKSSDL